ncbi:MAG: hypothetical protein ACUVXF_10595 [Desulfobaccales bacterium]
MAREYFREQHREPLREALVVAEEMTSDYFKLSSRHWLRARYDISTLAQLREEEISSHALALVAKYDGYPCGRLLKSLSFDFYRICLQDHNILKTLAAQRELRFFPFLCYILTHELIHIVRFSKFEARFDAGPEERHAEEGRVHRLTWEILAPLNFLDLGPVIKYYQKFWQGGCEYAHL